MAKKDKAYDYDSKIKQFEQDKNSEAIFYDCVNRIIVKPVVNITANIEGLETNTFVTNTNEGNQDDKLECEDENVEWEGDSINCIIIKPVVEIDIEISGLNTNITM